MQIAFINGSIDVGDPDAHTDRVYVVDGRIAAWPDTLPETADIVDLAGGHLRAGFADGHTHPFLAGRELLGPQLRHLTTVAGIAEAVGAWADENPDAEWIVGGSYDATMVDTGLFDATWLDSIDRPVVLRAWDYHTVWCNSRALEMAGITSETPDPPLGRIVHRADGTPMGTLVESAALLVLDRVPEVSLDRQVEILGRATRTLASYGITWTQEAWAEDHELDAWIAAAQRGALHLDVDIAVRADPLRWVAQLDEIVAVRERVADAPGISCDTVKFFIDGIIENHTAAMLDDYTDVCSRGLPNWNADQLGDALLDVHRIDRDIHMHAIGDAGVRAALDAVTRLRVEDPEGRRRVTVAHAQVIHPDDLERFADLGVAVCFQPLWARPDDVMVSLTFPRVGPDRERQYQIGSVMRTGASVTFGSDWPVSSPNVLEGISVAVTRQNPDGTPQGGWYPEERITVDAALATASAAVHVQSRRGADRGELRVGNLADLVWLDRDPRAVHARDLAETRVLGTWCRGRETYRRAENSG